MEKHCSTSRLDIVDGRAELFILRPAIPSSGTLRPCTRAHLRGCCTDGSRCDARALVPAARFEVLESVGHVTMLDDPELVAATIRRSVAAAKRPDFSQGRTGFAGE